MTITLRSLRIAVGFAALAVAPAAPGVDTPRVAVLPPGAIVPDAEIDERGVIHVAYLAEDDLYYVRSRDEGRTFSEPIRVNSEEGFASGGGFRGPDLAVGRGGRIHVIWYNAGYQQKRPPDQWGVMYAHLDRDAEGFSPAQNLNRKPSDNFALAADQTGRVAVIWMAEGVFANLSRDGGDSFGPPEDLGLDPCECCGSRAIFTSQGTLAILYRDKTNNLRDTNLAFRDPKRGSWSSQKISQTAWPIDSCPMTGGFLDRTSTGLAAAWETKGQPYFALIAPSPNATTPRETKAASSGRYPVVLTIPDGRTLVAWKRESALEWQSFDSEQQPVGERGQHPSAGPHRPAGVVTKSGLPVLIP